MKNLFVIVLLLLAFSSCIKIPKQTTVTMYDTIYVNKYINHTDSIAYYIHDTTYVSTTDTVYRLITVYDTIYQKTRRLVQLTVNNQSRSEFLLIKVDSTYNAALRSDAHRVLSALSTFYLLKSSHAVILAASPQDASCGLWSECQIDFDMNDVNEYNAPYSMSWTWCCNRIDYYDTKYEKYVVYKEQSTFACK